MNPDYYCQCCGTRVLPEIDSIPEFCNTCSTKRARPISVYTQIGYEIGALVTEKQKAYGDSFGKTGAVMRILYPEGIPPEKMDDALTITRILDKLFRIATDRDALGESPWRDIAGYAILSVERQKR